MISKEKLKEIEELEKNNKCRYWTEDEIEDLKICLRRGFSLMNIVKSGVFTRSLKSISAKYYIYREEIEHGSED